MSIKRMAASCVVAAVLSGSVSVAPANSFDDVPAGAFFETPVDWMADQEITTGRTAEIFDPDAPVTRAESATFLWRLVHRPGASKPSSFEDIPAGMFFTDAVAWLAESGITTGRTEEIFDPDAPVTRAEVGTFLWRFMCEPAAAAPTKFTDVPAGTFYSEAVAWMEEAEITTGRTAEIFDPHAAVTRGEVATFIWRLAGEPSVGSAGTNRVTLAGSCDGTPPPPAPGVGALSLSTSSISFGDVGVNIEASTSVTLENTGSVGGPGLFITAVESDDPDVTVDFDPVSLPPGGSVVVPVRYRPSELGADAATVTVWFGGSNGPSKTVSVTGNGVLGTIHRINAGGAAVGEWTADSLASPSSLHNMTGSSNRVSSTADSVTGSGSVPQAVMQSARIDLRHGSPMEWTFPVPAAGKYLVRLHFADIGANIDQMGVVLQGEPALTGFDPGLLVGEDAAVVRSFAVEAVDSISIEFAHTNLLNDVYVNGLEVLAMGSSPVGYISATQSIAFGSVDTTTGSSTRTVTVTNLGGSAVTIPIPAAASGFTPSTSSLNVPALSSAEFDVTFDPSADGRSSRWLELVAPGETIGVDLHGQGGTGTSAEMIIDTKNHDSTVFNAGSFIIKNTSATASIVSVSFDLGGAVLEDLEVDSTSGPAIAIEEKDWTNDFSAVTVASQTGVDGAVYSVSFAGFDAGETVFGSIDIDPLSSLGELSNATDRAGRIHGLELVGASMTVTFSDSTVITSPVWASGGATSSFGGFANFTVGTAPAAPVISIAGLADDDSTATASHTLGVVCSGTDTITLVQVEADLLTVVGAPAPTAGGNRVIANRSGLYTSAACAAGTASFAVTLTDEAPGVTTGGGWNHFIVLQGDASTSGTGVATASNRLSVRYDAP